MKSEKSIYKDPVSQVPVTQLTDYKGHSHHFYFTNPGWYDNGNKLLIGSDRNNRTNLFSIDLLSDRIEQLTDLEPVPKPRELEFQHACKNPVYDEVYFWHDLSLTALDLESGKIRTLFTLDGSHSVSMTLSCSAEGRHIYLIAREDLSDKIHTDILRGYVGFKETWEARPHCRIIKVPVDGNNSEIVFEDKYWLGHVNASPTEADILTFCHEGPWDLVDHRIWCLNIRTRELKKLRPTSQDETVGHEYWFRDGIHIGYHGTAANGKHLLGHVRYDNGEYEEYAFSRHPGHIFSHDRDFIVGDGGGVIKVWKLDGKKYSAPRILCRHDSSMHIQQSHPHPIISPDDKYIIFTSDRSGYANVYKVPVVAWESLPSADR